MKDSIRVTVSADHTLECSTNVIGRAGESETAQFEIAVPEKLRAWWTYVEFRKPNGETFRTANLEVAQTGIATYKVPLYLLSEDGEIEVQLVFQNEKGKIWKSATKKYIIDGSINATEEVPIKEDFVAQAQALIDIINGEVQEIADALAVNSAFADAVVEACGGQTKVNTIDGQALKFWVGTQKEYDDIWVKDPNTLYYIDGDTTYADIYEKFDEHSTAINEVLYSKDATDVAGNLDNLTAYGRYYCDASDGTPDGQDGVVEVYRRHFNTVQVFYSFRMGCTYIRFSSYPDDKDKKWSEWKSTARKAKYLDVAPTLTTSLTNECAISSAGLYVVIRSDYTDGKQHSDLLFIYDIRFNVYPSYIEGKSSEDTKTYVYYDGLEQKIKATGACDINQVYKLGEISSV